MRSKSSSAKTLGALAILLAVAAGACDVNTDAGLYIPDAGDGGPAKDATVSDGPVGQDSSDTDGNVGTDSGPDVQVIDTGVADTGKDTGTDTGTDAGTDTGTDAGTDTGTDAGTDTGTDAGADADDGSADAADGDGGPLCKTTFAVTALGNGAYQIDGANNPTLDVCKGDTVTFNVNAPGHPFWIKTIQTAGQTGAYNDGVTNNGMSTATITWVVSAAAPTPLFYDCEFHGAMTGTINVH